METWSSSWAWYGLWSFITPSPCLCGKMKGMMMPRNRPQSRGCWDGFRTRSHTCPSPTLTRTGKMAKLWEPWSTAVLQVSAHNCLNHLSRVERVGPKPGFLWGRLFVVAVVGLLVLVHCKTEDEPQMFGVLFQRSVHTHLPVSYSNHQRSPRAWILSRLWGYNPDSSPVSSHIGASFPVGLKKTCGSLQWLGMGI